jgi:hypothetical protein
VVLVLDLPRPASVHRLGGRIGQDRLVGRAGPAAHHRTVAKQRRREAGVRLGQRPPQQFAAEAAGVHEEVRFELAAVFEHDR